MIIDFLSFTTKTLTKFDDGELTIFEIKSQILEYFNYFLKDVPVDLVVSKNKSGLFGYIYSFSIELLYLNTGHTCRLGTFAFGGNSGSCYFQITGVGCSYINISLLYKFINTNSCKITRIDLALDLNLESKQYDFDYFIQSYKDGLFKHLKSPSNPKHLCIGDFLDPLSPSGRTLYIGSRKGRKFARIYEKGKEKGVINTDWIRFEIEFKAVDHSVISSDCLLNIESMFLEAYPICSNFVNAVSKNYRTYIKKISSDVVVSHYVETIKKQYGSSLSFLTKYCDVSLSDLVNPSKIPSVFGDVYDYKQLISKYDKNSEFIMNLDLDFS